MRNVFLACGFVAFSTFAAAQSAVDVPQASPLIGARPEGTRYQMCQSWSPTQAGFGYVCNFTSYEELLDSWDLHEIEQAFNNMQQRINELETRIARLEATRP